MSDARWLDHTADVGADLVADDLPALFRGALDALVAVMLETPPMTPDGERTIRLSASTREQLLVRWLEEWVFLVQSARRVPVDAALDIREPDAVALAPEQPADHRAHERDGSPDGWRLTARVRDATLDPVEHGWLGEVKGATFHGMRIEREGDRWRARVVFDV